MRADSASERPSTGSETGPSGTDPSGADPSLAELLSEPRDEKGHALPPGSPEAQAANASGPSRPLGSPRPYPASSHRAVTRRTAMGMLAAGAVVVVGGGGYLLSRSLPQERPAGPTTLTVPDVTGMERAKAVKALSKEGLRHRVESGTSQSVPEGHVVSTSPSAGQSVDRNEPVVVVVSVGPSHVRVPDTLKGVSEEKAKKILEEHGLKAGPPLRANSATVAEGDVVETSPEPGEDVAIGTAVILTLSTGEVTVPNVQGMSLRDAKAALEADSVRLPYEVEHSRGTGWPGGTVARQSERPNSSVKAGTKVKLVVSTDPGKPKDRHSSPSPSAPGRKPSPNRPPSPSKAPDKAPAKRSSAPAKPPAGAAKPPAAPAKSSVKSSPGTPNTSPAPARPSPASSRG
ncbi:PASTA domain-containing protein [Arthrobacter sp. UM1]|uniref:PASTA domain-containing protein n=1 Tax=Arthrobacter sp. UM1 TaxID=2766776 RepID=UPI001CF679E4|nr:PASTA domain-containing protein [Arthrobacter sp. UM1]MCB4208674.1 PASTA domain-containing protein [Arthrobacter sp. UM1]